MIQLIAEILMVAGAAFVTLAGLGMLRFQGAVLARMHAATKAPTLGFLLIGVGSAAQVEDWSEAVKLVLAVALVLMTAPVAAHLIGRAAYDNEAAAHRVGDIDELADHVASDAGRAEE